MLAILRCVARSPHFNLRRHARRVVNGSKARSTGSICDRWITSHRFTNAYVKELTGQAVEVRKSRKSMLGLLATVYRTSSNARLGGPCVVAVYRRQAKGRAQFFRCVFAQRMGMTRGDWRLHANSPIRRSCCSASSGVKPVAAVARPLNAFSSQFQSPIKRGSMDTRQASNLSYRLSVLLDKQRA